MLLNIEKNLNKDDKSEIVRKIAQVLLSGTRETDIKGWFRYDAIIGVIFTEMGNIDKNFIRQKIFQYLCSLFKQEQVKNIEISFYSFPSENGKKDFGTAEEGAHEPGATGNKDVHRASPPAWKRSKFKVQGSKLWPDRHILGIAQAGKPVPPGFL